MSRLLGRGEARRTARKRRIRHALYRSYALLGSAPIEFITEPIPDQIALGKAKRIEEVTYESPDPPLSYSATVLIGRFGLDHSQ
jgi:hypothetical protein